MTDYNLYIHSKNRSDKETAYDFNLYLQNPIICKDNEYIRVDVMSFYMINTMYNISSLLGNNSFEIQILQLNDIPFTSKLITIPDGNYSVLSFRDTVKLLFANQGIDLVNKIDIIYNYYNNTYTLIRLDALYKYKIRNIKCQKALPITNLTEITYTGVSTSYINMVEYQQIIIKSDLIYQDLNQDNIIFLQDDKFNISQILFWINKQDVEPFKCISYKNDDGGDSFSYNIVNKYINKINFKITNENNNTINDCPEWFLHLKFNIQKRHNIDYERVSNIFISLLNDIKYILMRILFKK